MCPLLRAIFKLVTQVVYWGSRFLLSHLLNPERYNVPDEMLRTTEQDSAFGAFRHNNELLTSTDLAGIGVLQLESRSEQQVVRESADDSEVKKEDLGPDEESDSHEESCSDEDTLKEDLGPDATFSLTEMNHVENEGTQGCETDANAAST